MCSVREWETRPVNRKRQKSVHRPDPRLTEDRSDHLETPTQPHQSPLPPRVWRLSETGNSSITSSTFHPSHRSRSAFLVPSILFFLERGTDVSAPLRVIISRRHEYHSVPGTDGGGKTRRQSQAVRPTPQRPAHQRSVSETAYARRMSGGSAQQPTVSSTLADFDWKVRRPSVHDRRDAQLCARHGDAPLTRRRSSRESRCRPVGLSKRFFFISIFFLA